MKRSRFVVGAVLSGALGAAVACSFPDVSFKDGAGSQVDGEEDAAIISPPSDGPATVDADVPDVEPGETLDAASLIPVDAAGCTTCDCDGDGYDRVDDAGCRRDGGGGKPVDCDDTIKAINPGNTKWISNRWPTSSKHPVIGDWDCSGITEKDPPSDVTACKPAALGLVGCANAYGFEGDPGCGEEGDGINCAPPVIGLVGCNQIGVFSNTVQRCK